MSKHQDETETVYGDITVKTAKAILFDPYVIEPVWIPLTQIYNLQEVMDCYNEGKKDGVKVVMSAWIFKQKGIPK
jgi:hypothetical protein